MKLKEQHKHILRSETDKNNYIETEVDAGKKVVTLTIWNYNDFEDISLTQDQIAQVVQQLGAWLAHAKGLRRQAAHRR